MFYSIKIVFIYILYPHCIWKWIIYKKWHPWSILLIQTLPSLCIFLWGPSSIWNLPTQILNLLNILCFPNLNVKDSNLFYQDGWYILIIETYFDEWIETIRVAFQVSIFIIKFITEIHMFYTGYAIMKDKSKIPNALIHCK